MAHLPLNSTGPLCEADPDRDEAWCAYHRTEHDPDPDAEVEVTVRIRARVYRGYGPTEVADALRVYLGVSSLDSLEADIGAVHIYDAKVVQP